MKQKMDINSENKNPYGLKVNEIDLENTISANSDRLLIKRILDLLSEEKAEEIIFIDAKLHDIPNTMMHAVKSLKDLNINYLTVHISSGLEALRAVKKNIW